MEGILSPRVHPENLRYHLHSFEWISLRPQASITVTLWLPHWLCDSPRCSQTHPNCTQRTPVPVIRDPSHSEGWLECPPRVWFSPEIDASTFTLRLLSHTPGGSQWLKYILLMVGYARASPCIAQIAWMADNLPWYLHRQVMGLPSLPGQSS